MNKREMKKAVKYWMLFHSIDPNSGMFEKIKRSIEIDNEKRFTKAHEKRYLEIFRSLKMEWDK
tara:strand:+ start:340 stop:528 length:189 start_codon:yes stop_codon:yes gene_type:complete